MKHLTLQKVRNLLRQDTIHVQQTRAHLPVVGVKLSLTQSGKFFLGLGKEIIAPYKCEVLYKRPVKDKLGSYHFFCHEPDAQTLQTLIASGIEVEHSS